MKRAREIAFLSALAMAGTSILAWAGEAFWHWMGWPVAPQRALLVLADPSAPLLLKAQILAVAVVVSPIVEEVLFRWGLFGRCFLRIAPVWAAAVASGALFAAVHLFPAGFGALWYFGTMLALLYRRAGTLLAAVGCHALFNALNAAYCMFA